MELWDVLRHNTNMDETLKTIIWRTTYCVCGLNPRYFMLSQIIYGENISENCLSKGVCEHYWFILPTSQKWTVLNCKKKKPANVFIVISSTKQDCLLCSPVSSCPRSPSPLSSETTTTKRLTWPGYPDNSPSRCCL